MNPSVIVIGGANMDIGGSPSGDFRLHDSNPGVVHLRPGGVGRNIAHNLHLLGAQVSLITALGDDFFGEALRRSCNELGLDLSMSLTAHDLRTSTYLYLNEPHGDMHAAIADMGITARLTPDYLKAMRRSEPCSAVVQDPYGRENGVYGYGAERAGEMEQFLVDELTCFVPKNKIFRWEEAE